jgi:RluA family pseudouridine synthase
MTPETILQSKVPPAFHGQRLLDYLCGRFPYRTRDEWESLIRKGKVRVNGQKPGPTQVLHKGNLVSTAQVLEEPPVDKGIALLHEEEAFLVAFKPGNLPSHADGSYVTHTFIHLLQERMAAAGNRGFLGLVHRLDRETSGVMLVARTKAAQGDLAAQFEGGRVDKDYLAWVRGRPEVDRFECPLPIGPAPGSSVSIRRKALPAGTAGALEALTRFEVVERRPDRALVRCRPTTGRTHQIRVHLEACGHPVVGDKLYGRSDSEFLEFVRRAKGGRSEGWTGRFGAERQLLHAHKLAFDHPVTGARVVFEAPPPGDMA